MTRTSQVGALKLKKRHVSYMLKGFKQILFSGFKKPKGAPCSFEDSFSEKYFSKDCFPEKSHSAENLHREDPLGSLNDFSEVETV